LYCAPTGRSRADHKTIISTCRMESGDLPGQITNEEILLADASKAGEMIDSLVWLQRCNFLHRDMGIVPDQSRPTAKQAACSLFIQLVYKQETKQVVNCTQKIYVLTGTIASHDQAQENSCQYYSYSALFRIKHHLSSSHHNTTPCSASYICWQCGTARICPFAYRMLQLLSTSRTAIDRYLLPARCCRFAMGPCLDRQMDDDFLQSINNRLIHKMTQRNTMLRHTVKHNILVT